MDQLENSESALGVRDSPIWFLTLLFWRRVGGGFVLCVEYGDAWDDIDDQHGLARLLREVSWRSAW